MNIILCGHHGTGKTTVGKLLAVKYGLNFVDTDNLFEQTHGVPCEYYREHGAKIFRDREQDVVCAIDASENTVIATGGGVLMRGDSVNHLKSLGQFIFLHSTADVLLARIKKQNRLPGFLKSFDDFPDYYSARKKLYESLADHTIDTQDKSIDEIVSLIEQYRCHHGE